MLGLFVFSSAFDQDSSESSCYVLSFGIADNFWQNKFYMDIAVKKIIDESARMCFFSLDC